MGETDKDGGRGNRNCVHQVQRSGLVANVYIYRLMEDSCVPVGQKFDGVLSIVPSSLLHRWLVFLVAL